MERTCYPQADISTSFIGTDSFPSAEGESKIANCDLHVLLGTAIPSPLPARETTQTLSIAPLGTQQAVSGHYLQCDINAQCQQLPLS